MLVIDAHEVSIDVYGDGKDIWTAKWDGGAKVRIFRGDFINNRVLFNHMYDLEAEEGMTLKQFCDWATNLLNKMIVDAEVLP